MVKRLFAFLLVLALVCCLFGCHSDPEPTPADTTTTANGKTTVPTSDEGGETTTSETEITTQSTYTVQTDAKGNTVVVDGDGNVIADSGDGDTIETKDNGEIVIVDSDGSTVTIPPTTTTTTAPSTTCDCTTSTGSSKTETTHATTTTTAHNEPKPVSYEGILPGSAAAGVAFSTLAKAPGDNPVTVAEDTKQFGRFLLMSTDNPALPFNVACHIEGDRITALVPAGIDLSSVKANFTYYGKTVTYNGAELTSRTTAMDLSKDATLTLTAKNGSTRTVTVHIERLATGLPSMSLTTSGYAAVTSTTEYKAASYTIGGGNKSVCAYATDKAVKGSDCSMKGRGNTSWTYDKKCYTLRFDMKHEMLGLPESKNFVLLAMYSDQSLMRYRVAEYLSEQMGLQFTMNMRYVDLWLNGEYVGVYGLVEKIEVEKNHVNITDYTTSSVPANKIGYLLEFDDHLYNNASEAQRKKWTTVGKGFYDPTINETFFYSNVLGESWVLIRTTNAKSLTADHVNYIQAVVNLASEALKKGDYATISNYIDVESFVNWYLIEEYLNNTDTDMTSSVYMYIDVGGKLKLGPLWDMDNCAGNHTATASATGHALYDSKNGWFSYLFKCKEARDILKTRWAKMKTVLSSVDGTIDSTATMLKEAATVNFDRWELLGKNLSTQPAAIASANTYQKQVDYLKTYLDARESALDAFYKGL